MDRTQVTQQTSTTLPLHGELAHEAPSPTLLGPGIFRGPLQWALEGPGWDILRPGMDFVLLCAAVIAALGGVHGVLHGPSTSAPLLALPPLALLLFYLHGLYRTRLRALILDGLVAILAGVSVAAMAVAALGLLANGRVPEQTDWVRGWLFAFLGVGLGRVLMACAQRWARARRLVGKPVLIMGAGMVGAQVARRLESHPEYGLTPVGFLDEQPRAVAEVGGRDVPVLGTLEDLEKAVRRTNARNVIVAFSSVADARISRLIQTCQELGIDVSVVPRMFDTISNRVAYDTVGALPLLSFSSVNPNGLQFAVKYAADRVLAALILVVLSPLLALIALAVKLTTGGPVFFSQTRVGLDGHEFKMLKFCTMRGCPEEVGESDAAWAERIVKGDGLNGSVLRESAGQIEVVDVTAEGGSSEEDRRTGVGRLLRRLSLDELPQLFNILRGDMSLVGPRPERVSYVRVFEQVVRRYPDRHRVKSGVTGWAQVHGLRGQTSLADRVEWDNYYITHWSLGLDLKILAMTLVALLRGSD